MKISGEVSSKLNELFIMERKLGKLWRAGTACLHRCCDHFIKVDLKLKRRLKIQQFVQRIRPMIDYPFEALPAY